MINIMKYIANDQMTKGFITNDTADSDSDSDD